jgi:putative protease
MIELLAPAGNFKCLITAINAGCDAVYFGLQDFNMRATSQNFKISDLAKIKKICDKNEVKRYLTLNTIIYDEELKRVETIIKRAKKYIDAVICSDLAVILLCKKYKVPFHISTQCSVSNSETARFYKNLGAERIVLARELNLKQIKKISKIIPVEVFVHGAMCVSISGRCFTSQFLFNKSANKGECLQPCRRSYIVKDDEGNQLRVENSRIFSAKDLCALSFIDKLKKAGVASFKIEGRNREPEYIDKVVRSYRKAIDNNLTKEEIEKELEELKKVYNRKFSSGFLIKIPTSDDFSNIENSSASQSKKFVGKIVHYYDKIKVGLVFMNADKLKIGDEIIIIGKTTPVVYYKIESMEINNKKIKEVKKGEKVAIELPFCRKGDDLYKVIKK